jgi:hypothetical protein
MWGEHDCGGQGGGDWAGTGFGPSKQRIECRGLDIMGGVKTVCRVVGWTPYYEGCVVVGSVGGANGEITRRRGIEPKTQNIEPRGLNIGGGKKRPAGYVVEPYWMRYIWWSKAWEG